MIKKDFSPSKLPTVCECFTRMGTWVSSLALHFELTALCLKMNEKIRKIFPDIKLI